MRLAMGRRLRLEGERVSGMVWASYWDWREMVTLRWVGILLVSGCGVVWMRIDELMVVRFRDVAIRLTNGRHDQASLALAHQPQRHLTSHASRPLPVARNSSISVCQLFKDPGRSSYVYWPEVV